MFYFAKLTFGTNEFTLLLFIFLAFSLIFRIDCFCFTAFVIDYFTFAYAYWAILEDYDLIWLSLWLS